MKSLAGTMSSEDWDRRRVWSMGPALLMLALLALTTAVMGCGGKMAAARDLENRGDLQGAVAIYRAALEEDPDDLEALSGAAVGLSLLGLYDEALALQERLVSLDPGDVQTRIELGFNYLNHQNRPLDAAAVMSEAVALQPTAKNLTFLAQAQMACGDTEKAESTLWKAVQTDPDYPYSYSRLLSLLSAQGRTDGIEELQRVAAAHGVSIVQSE